MATLTQNNYRLLNRAQLSFEYLHTNSTTHEFLFGALAELLDNSRDANAKEVRIFTEKSDVGRGGFLLFVLDDGEGMTPEEVTDVIMFGKSVKKSKDAEHIGMYGNGLKSGSMRIGNDMILFTKSSGKLTALFLSRSFHEQENLAEIFVPIPSFNADDKSPLGEDETKYRCEMDLILKYSPFRSEQEFFKQFDKISTDSGTLIVIYNMKLTDSGDAELDIKSDQTDIRLSSTSAESLEELDSNEGLHEEKYSFRAYTSILYKNPKMKVYIQNVKVRTKRLEITLYKPRMYRYTSNRFKARSEKEAKEAELEAKRIKMSAQEAMSKAKQLEIENGGDVTNKEKLSALRKANDYAAHLQRQATFKRNLADKLLKSLNQPKELHFYFGVNLNNRRQDGLFVYNSGRLIRMYDRAPSQLNIALSMQGVMGIVDVPYTVLEPTHNKQDFADSKEYAFLKRAMDQHLQAYWKDIDVGKGILDFWCEYGYMSKNWSTAPSTDPKYIKKRRMQIHECIQCDKCLKWRFPPFSAGDIGKEFPDTWSCADNKDSAHKNCSVPEHKAPISERSLPQKPSRLEDPAVSSSRSISASSGGRSTSLDSAFVSVPSTAAAATASSSPRGAATGPSIPPTSLSKSKPSATVTPTSQTSSRPQRSVASASVPPTVSASSASTSSKVNNQVSSSSDSQRESRGAKLRADSRISSSSSSRTPPRVLEPPAKSSRRSEPIVSSSSSGKKFSTKPSTPPSKSKLLSSQRSGRKVVNAVSSSEEEDEDSDDEPLIKRKKQTTATASPVKLPSGVSVGSAVSALNKGNWSRGRIVQIERQRGIKVKFDANKQEKYDRWYQANSPNIKFLKGTPKPGTSPKGTSTATAAASSPNKQQQQLEKKAQEALANNKQLTQEIKALNSNIDTLMTQLKDVIRFFHPPTWKQKKEDIDKMKVEDMKKFPMTDFFEHYERNLRGLIQNHQEEAEAKDAKLKAMRQNVAKLLQSISEISIDPEGDLEDVDQILANCIEQVQASQTDDSADGGGGASN